MALIGGEARFKSNSDDTGFLVKIGTRIMQSLGNLFGSAENCSNIRIVLSFGTPTL